jgi:6,7-dimethyl-8-ribityllumazine synthase
MTVYRGGLAPEPGSRYAIVVGRFNLAVTERLAAGAQDALTSHGVPPEAIDVVWVPGAFEIPQAARWAVDSGRYHAVIAVGAVIRGDTPHFDYVAGAAAHGLETVAAAAAIPVAFGVLTCDTMEQARDRADGKAGNKGWEAALAALEMVSLRAAFRTEPNAD